MSPRGSVVSPNQGKSSDEKRHHVRRLSPVHRPGARAVRGALRPSWGSGGKRPAPDSTEIQYYNNTSATLTLASIGDWANQQWVTTEAGGPTCLDGPPATIPPGGSGCFYSQATGLPTNGTGPHHQRHAAAAARLRLEREPGRYAQTSYSVAFQWFTPWQLSRPTGDDDWSASALITEITGTPPFGSTATSAWRECSAPEVST